MTRYAYLIKVDADENNNKYYEMREDPDGRTFTATYGRVNHTSQQKKYAIGKWQAIYNQKLNPKKGYTDATAYHAQVATTTQTDVPTLIHPSPIVRSIFDDLQGASRQTFNKNYSVTNIGAVTQMMIDDAQAQLNLLVDQLNAANWIGFNNNLQRLFLIIPRRMDGKVREYLLDLSNASETAAKDLITNEQSLLDVVRGQVVTTGTSQVKENLLDVMNLEVDEVTQAEITMIRQKLGESANRFVQAIRLVHRPTLVKFKETFDKLGNPRLEWHGSRNENWVSILTTGLMLYPTSAVISGKMFGYGLYFAPKAKKSIGYTSVRGSYWANGSAANGYLALFHLAMGRQLDVARHMREHQSLTAAKLQQQGYDSLYAKGGIDLINDEIIVYGESQATAAYLVQIR